MQIKRAARFLIDAKSMIFGVAVFNLVWVWMRSPEWNVHRNAFMAGLLLCAAILLIVNKSWSNLIAAILSGYLPVEVLWAFWMIAEHAEVPVFSYRHFHTFVRAIDIEGGVLLFIGLALVILTRAIFAVLAGTKKIAAD